MKKFTLFILIIFLVGFASNAFAKSTPEHVLCEVGDTCIPASGVYSEIGTTGVYGEVFAPYGCTNKDYPLWDEAILNYSPNNDCVCHKNICTSAKYLESNINVFKPLGNIALFLLLMVPILLVIFTPIAYIYYDAQARGLSKANIFLWILFSLIGIIIYFLTRKPILENVDVNLLRKRDIVMKYAIKITIVYVVFFVAIALFYYIGSIWS